jgi:hypothetical protein
MGCSPRRSRTRAIKTVKTTDFGEMAAIVRCCRIDWELASSKGSKGYRCFLKQHSRTLLRFDHQHRLASIRLRQRVRPVDIYCSNTVAVWLVAVQLSGDESCYERPTADARVYSSKNQKRYLRRHNRKLCASGRPTDATPNCSNTPVP